MDKIKKKLEKHPFEDDKFNNGIKILKIKKKLQ